MAVTRLSELYSFIYQHWYLEGLVWTALSLIVGLLVYARLRQRVHSARAPQATVNSRRRLLMVAILLLVLLVLTRVWLQAPYGSIVTEGANPQHFLESLLWSLAVIIVVASLVKAVQRSLLSSETEIETRHRTRQMTHWLGMLVLCLALVLIWSRQFKNVSVFLGIVGAGLALSMGETLLCIAGWGILVVRRPFDIGDRIEIDKHVGDVVNTGMFHTSLVEVGNWVKADQSTGRLLIIPNSMILRHPVCNYTKGFPFIWDEFSTVVTFESDWEAAKEIMTLEAEEEAEKIESEVKRRIEEMQSQYAIRYGHLRPIVYTSIADHGTRLTLRYLTPVRQRRAATHRITEDILRAFIRHPHIDFAYPTMRIFRNTEEGKGSLGGPDQRPGASAPEARPLG